MGEKGEEEIRRAGGLPVRVLNVIIIILALVLAVFFWVTASETTAIYGREAAVTGVYHACELAANEMREASDNLTTQVRMFAITLDRQYIDSFILESKVAMRREKSLAALQTELSDEKDAISALEEALFYSVQLEQVELYSMKLGSEAMGYDVLELSEIKLNSDDMSLSREAKIAKATDIVVNETYRQYKEKIYSAVDRCIAILTRATETQETKTEAALQSLLFRQKLLVVLTLALVLATILIVVLLIIRPLENYTRDISLGEKLKPAGAGELRYMAEAYNEIFEENKKANENLRHAAEHDSLTRLFNRRAFESLREQYRKDIALLQVDVDHFKTFNDTYGHDVGDKVLQKVAKYLRSSFRFSDYPCRIGGDEFAVIMTGMTPEMKDVVMQKVRLVRSGLMDTSDGLPPITLSIGVSFGSGESADAIYKAADIALYNVKERGKNGMSFFIDGKVEVGI